jgi:DNA-binding XRE family transcriptional regulator/tetratricopeptide (TPR) repeat protein
LTEGTSRRRTRFVHRRKALGLTQEGLAELLGVDRSTVVRWERAETEPHPAIRPQIAEKLGCTLAELDELLSHVGDVGQRPMRRPETVAPDVVTTGGGTTDRRAFAVTTALAVLGVARPLAALVTDDVRRPFVGSDHVQLLETAINNIEGRDAAIGGDALFGAGQRLYRVAGRWLEEAAPPAEIRDAIQTLMGELSCWLGWLAFDADRRDQARRYLHEAVVVARLTDDPFLEVRTMASICLLTLEDRPHESLQCAQAALRLSAAWASPRLALLLHMRAARAYAALGDERGFQRELAKATVQLDRGLRDDEPVYLHFVSPSEFAGIAGLGHLAMDQPDRAAVLFRQIVADPDPAYKRNVGYYTVRLADALGRQGDITGACEAGREAMNVVAGLDSARTIRFLGQFRRAIQPHLAASVEARSFADAYDDLYASAR